MELGKNPYLFR